MRRKDLSVVIVVVMATALIVPAPPRAIAEATADDDLAQIQGFWERKTGEDVPGIARATKEIRGSHETVTYYGEGDKVLRAHEVDLKVERRAGIRIFTYSNWT